MTTQELYQHLADRTGEDLETIELLGFELETPHYESDRKELKRQLRRLRLWRKHAASPRMPSASHHSPPVGRLRRSE